MYDEDEVWEIPPIGVVESLDAVWEDPNIGDPMVMALRMGMWAIGCASKVMEAEHRHMVVFLLVKQDRSLMSVSEEDVAEGIQEMSPIARMLSGGDGQDPEPKHMLGQVVKAAVKDLQPMAVVQVAEAFMMSVKLGMGPEALELVKKVQSGEIEVADLPDSVRDEVLIVRCELPDGGVVLLRRKILRDGEEFSGLGPVESMIDATHQKLAVDPDHPGGPQPGAFDDGGRADRAGAMAREVKETIAELTADTKPIVAAAAEAWKYE